MNANCKKNVKYARNRLHFFPYFTFEKRQKLSSSIKAFFSKHNCPMISDQKNSQWHNSDAQKKSSQFLIFGD